MAILTIGGQIGAGKTTLAASLANALHYEEWHVGHIFRELARERGETIERFYAELQNDPNLEKTVDDRQKRMMQEHDNLVIQGRVAWFFAKDSSFTVFNIFLAVDPKIGAERTGKRRENAGRSVEELVKANAARERDEKIRYKKLYEIENFLDLSHYDFVLDTSKLTEEEVFARTLGKIRERLEADV